MSVYLPMIPELVYTMLACARIGAVHSVVVSTVTKPFYQITLFRGVCGFKVTKTIKVSQIKHSPPIRSLRCVLAVHDCCVSTYGGNAVIVSADRRGVARRSDLVPTRRLLQLNLSSRLSCRLLHATGYQLFFDSTCARYVAQTFPGCFQPETAGRPTPF